MYQSVCRFADNFYACQYHQNKNLVLETIDTSKINMFAIKVYADDCATNPLSAGILTLLVLRSALKDIIDKNVHDKDCRGKKNARLTLL